MISFNNKVEYMMPHVQISGYKIKQHLRKTTTHQYTSFYDSIFKALKNDIIYIAKLFNQQHINEYQNEVSCLKRLKNNHILEYVKNYQQNEKQQAGQYKVLILPYAKYGDLSDYLPKNGKLSENVARTLFKQLLDGLQYAANINPSGIIHPDLSPFSVLLDSQRQVKICGWSKINSNSSEKKMKDLVFACGQILICMLTTQMPFYNKFPSDKMFQFISEKYIHKFWEIFTKRITSKDKNFQFSQSVKQLINNIFLRKWVTLHEILDSAWLKNGTYLSNEQLNQELELQQNKAYNQQIKKYQIKVTREKKNRQILEKYEKQPCNNTRSSFKQNQHFINDFQDSIITSNDIPILTSDNSRAIQVFDNRPNFVIASLKEQMRLKNLNRVLFSDQKFSQNSSVNVSGNSVEITLQLNQIVEGEDECKQNINAKIIFIFHQNQQHNRLYAEIQIFDCNVNQYYENLLKKFFQQMIQIPSNEKQFKKECQHQIKFCNNQ